MLALALVSRMAENSAVGDVNPDGSMAVHVTPADSLVTLCLTEVVSSFLLF